MYNKHWRKDTCFEFYVRYIWDVFYLKDMAIKKYYLSCLNRKACSKLLKYLLRDQPKDQWFLGLMYQTISSVRWLLASSWLCSMKLTLAILYKTRTCYTATHTYFALIFSQNVSTPTFISILYSFKVLRKTVFTACIPSLGCNFLRLGVVCLFLFSCFVQWAVSKASRTVSPGM